MKIMIEVSPGELIDKITILEIKKKKISDKEALGHVHSELTMLCNLFNKHIQRTEQPMEELIKKLKTTNQRLWDIEDDIRQCEQSKDFGNSFIKLARSVYKTNDQRSALKSQINNLLSSSIQEVKSYTDYS